MALTGKGSSSVSPFRFLLFFRLGFIRSVVVFVTRISIVLEQASFNFGVCVSSLCISGEFSFHCKAALKQYGTFAVVAVLIPFSIDAAARASSATSWPSAAGWIGRDQHTSKRGRESPPTPPPLPAHILCHHIFSNSDSNCGSIRR